MVECITLTDSFFVSRCDGEVVKYFFLAGYRSQEDGIEGPKVLLSYRCCGWVGSGVHISDIGYNNSMVFYRASFVCGFQVHNKLSGDEMSKLARTQQELANQPCIKYLSSI